MTFTVYTYTGERNRLNKSEKNASNQYIYLTKISEHSGTVRDMVDVVNPEILVQGDIKAGNYAYIDSFSGWYWIMEKTVVREGLTSIRMKRDPLHTFQTQIRNSRCICDRSASKYTMYVRDPKMRTNQYTHNESISGSVLFSYNGKFLLITTG